MSETITVTRKGEPTGDYDEQGSVVRADISFPIEIRAFAPRGSDESAEQSGPKVITGGTVYADAGTVLLPSDRLTIRGIVGWQVAGDPGIWVSMFDSDLGGLEVAVKRSP